jgi:3-dehydroquinate synthase
MTTVLVKADHTYPVVIDHGTINSVVDYLADSTRIAVIHPRSMTEVAGKLRANISLASSSDVSTVGIEVPDAENAKTAQVLEFCWSALGEAGFTRNDLIVSVGGGATTDLAGFVAATWLRGIRVVHVPTTLLAMVDAAVGGKTGINTAAGKNLVGAIYSPTAVVCDLDFLATQSPPDYVSGLAEVIKCGFIRDERILELIESDLTGAKSPSWSHAPEIISRAIQVKADVVGNDLRETLGTASGREILNYGHTFGHAIERQEKFSWRHGDAVSVGMMFVAHLANLAGRLDESIVERHKNILTGVGLPTTYPPQKFAELHDNMRIDKKSRGDQLRFIILGNIGQPEILQGPDTALLIAAHAKLGQGESHA